MSPHPPPEVRHLYDDALATLLSHRGHNDGQEALRRGFLRTLGDDPAAVSKAGPPAHLTGSCWVLSADATQVLLHLHATAILWRRFGGVRARGDASLRAGAEREALEESGLGRIDRLPDPIDLDRHQLGSRFGQCREHLDVRYLAFAPVGAQPESSDESEAVAWFPIEGLPDNMGADLPRLITVARAVVNRG